MADNNNIVITQAYFANNKAAIDALNEFFSSAFKVKNFPFLDEESSIDRILEKIISRLNSVDPTWLDDDAKLQEILSLINEQMETLDPVEGIYQSIVDSNNTTLINAVDGYIGFKVLQKIADNFQEFSKFVNGIYTFELFTKTSQYTDVLEIFSQPLSFDELPDLDIEEKIYSDEDYVNGVFGNDGISIPAELTPDIECERIRTRQDLQGVEVFVDDAVQEAAEVNYFENTKPVNIRYSPKDHRYIISDQFTRVINNLISGLRNCDTTEDLIKFFDTFTSNPNVFADNICPFILAKVFTNKKKYKRNPGERINDYTKSYDSILSQNKGARRFQSYDLFSTFKTDKEGTIKFIEDFLKLNLVNDKDAYISNNTLLNLFNIFDSRIYLDIIYNVTPESFRNNQNENQFVTSIRGVINKNSRTKNAYTKEDENAEAPETDEAEAVQEFVSSELKKFGEMSIKDLLYCEQFSDLVKMQIESIGNTEHNMKISPFLIDEYIGESYTDINSELYDLFEEANIQKRRETLRSAIDSLIADCEKIVDLNKKHQWNNNTFARQYRTTAGMMIPRPLFPFILPIPMVNSTGSTEQHTNIKQAHKWLKKAIKGKSGEFTPEQRQVMALLKDYVDDMWGTVKWFWVNPINWSKEMNIGHNTRIQQRVKSMANIATKIVALKPRLQFINDETFINESFYDGSPDFIYQEATTAGNMENLGKSVRLIIRDMIKLTELNSKGQWNNNACINFFKGEVIGNLKQAIKYTDRASKGLCGKLVESNVSSCNELNTKLTNILKDLKVMKANPFIGKNVKSSKQAIDIASLAKDISKMQSEFDWIKSAPKATNDANATPEETVEEMSIYNFDEFAMIMEATQVNDGKIPNYMKTRLKMSDKVGVSVTPEGLPEGIPMNPISDLTESIDTKADNGDSLDTMFGNGFDESKLNKSDAGKIVYNITNNYTNSFNQNSNNTTSNTNTTTNTTNDSSSGKTVNSTKNTTNTNSHNSSNSNNNTNSGNDNSHDNRSDTSSNKSNTRNDTKTSNVKNINKRDNSDHSTKTSTSGTNNNNNSNGSVDTKDSPTSKDDEQTLSSGKTVQEMFMFLESSEPQSFGSNAKYPKEDSLTKAMDRDKNTLAGQQEEKKFVTKIANTGKAVLKPLDRHKQWLTKVVDSLIKRDEDKVKASLIENPSYRSAVCKAGRLALKLGLTGVFWSIAPWMGVMYAGIQGLKLADKPRLKKEVMREMESELQVVEEKINDLNHMHPETPEIRKEKYEYMRIKKKLEDYLLRSPHATIKSPKEVW